MRVVVLFMLVTGCYVEGRGQFSRTYGGGGGGGFAWTDAHQDGELGVEIASSRIRPRPGELAAPVMVMMDARYAHAVDPGGHVRLYVRGAVGSEMCPDKTAVAAADGCPPTTADPNPVDVPHSSITEVGAGVALSLVTHDRHVTDEAMGWSLGALSIGVVHDSAYTAERGHDTFTGVDVSLLFGFDAITAIEKASRKRD